MLLFIHSLLLPPLFVRVKCYVFVLLCVLSSFAIISLGKRELVSLHFVVF